MRRLTRGNAARLLPKRFYTTVTVSAANSILLDGKPVKTPLKAFLQMPTNVLALAVAEEWQAQSSVIDPAKMPLTKLANTAIDRGNNERVKMMRELLDYANSDLVCYRAETPQELVQDQQNHWEPVLVWANVRLGTAFASTTGITHKSQAPKSLRAYETYVKTLDNFQLTALYSLTILLGSALIAAMLVEKGIVPESAWLAAHVDEDHQIRFWGSDEEAVARRHNRKLEFDAAVTFARLA